MGCISKKPKMDFACLPFFLDGNRPGLVKCGGGDCGGALPRSDAAKCCQGQTVDLDEAVAAAAVIKEAFNKSKHDVTIHPKTHQHGILTKPQCIQEWFLAGVNAYFAGLGITAGYMNMGHAHQTSERMEGQLARIKAKLDPVGNSQNEAKRITENSKGITENLKAHKLSLTLGLNCQEFIRFYAGLLPVVISGFVLVSTMIPVFMCPATLLMALYALGHVYRYGCIDYKRAFWMKPKDILSQERAYVNKGIEAMKKMRREEMTIYRLTAFFFAVYAVGALLCSAAFVLPMPFIFSLAGPLSLIVGSLAVGYLNNSSIRRIFVENSDDVLPRRKLGVLGDEHSIESEIGRLSEVMDEVEKKKRDYRQTIFGRQIPFVLGNVPLHISQAVLVGLTMGAIPSDFIAKQLKKNYLAELRKKSPEKRLSDLRDLSRLMVESIKKCFSEEKSIYSFNPVINQINQVIGTIDRSKSMGDMFDCFYRLDHSGCSMGEVSKILDLHLPEDIDSNAIDFETKITLLLDCFFEHYLAKLKIQQRALAHHLTYLLHGEKLVEKSKLFGFVQQLQQKLQELQKMNSWLGTIDIACLKDWLYPPNPLFSK